MKRSGVTGRILRICEVITSMAYVNLLWILFTILGLVFFGFMPATVALFAVTRKWVMGERDVPVFSLFWKTYRKEFFKCTLLGAILFVISVILYIDLAYLPPEGIFIAFRWILIICSFLYLIILLYTFPIYVHYKMNIKNYIKYALLLGAAYPHFTLLMMIGAGLLLYVILIAPGFIPFFSGSVLSYFIMWTAYQVFKKIDSKIEGTKQVAEAE